MIRFAFTLTALLLGFATYAQHEKPAKISSASLQEGFGPLRLGNDSITIIGKYLNYQPKKGDEFSVSVYDFLSTRQMEFKAAIDANGQFSIKVPAQAPCDIFLDWGVTWQRTIGVPGETIYYTADPSEYNDLNWEDPSFFNRKFSTRFQGTNSRLHMEILAFNNAYDGWFDNSYHSWSDENLPDLAYRDKVVHKKLLPEWAFLQSWIKQHRPEKRTIQYLEARVLCQTNYMLMQYLYKLDKLKQRQFSPGYLATVDSIRNVLPQLGYLSRDYQVVIRDMATYGSLVTGWNRPQAADSVYNTLKPLDIERELRLAREITAQYSSTSSPLPEADFQRGLAELKDPFVREAIQKRQQYFKDLDARMDAEMQLTGLFSDTTGLGQLTTTEAVYRHITAPYKGKVIYLDVWGTWCAPCRDEMQFAGELKKRLEGKDVAFIYLANNSAEKSWRNFIKDRKLYGKSTFHYNLPRAQQQLFEKQYLKGGYPTFILIDKSGKFVTNTAPRPSNTDEAVKAIEALL